MSIVIAVQPFSLGAPGGGPRILRSVLRANGLHPVPVCSAAGSVKLDPDEVQIPARPYFGRLEATRFGWIADYAGQPWRRRFEERLAALVARSKADSVHGLAHTEDYISAFAAARRAGRRFCVSVHDDVEYHARVRPGLRSVANAMPEIWRRADARIVITSAMGEEYCRRYGRRPFSVVTDGVQSVRQHVRGSGSNCIYFMGLLHRSYHANFAVLGQVISRLAERRHPSERPHLVARCGALPPEMIGHARVEHRPFGTDDDVQADLDGVGMLYLPLPFDRQFSGFNLFSLPTKLITYAAAGLPIIYHGPPDSAAAALLRRHDAALMIEALDVGSLLNAIADLRPERRSELARNALDLARSEFLLEDQRARFVAEVFGTA